MNNRWAIGQDTFWWHSAWSKMILILTLKGALPWFSDSNCGRGDILQSLKPNHGMSIWLFMSYVICADMTSLTITITDKKTSKKATNNVEDFSHSTRLLGATTLRWTRAQVQTGVLKYHDFQKCTWDEVPGWDPLRKVPKSSSCVFAQSLVEILYLFYYHGRCQDT